MQEHGELRLNAARQWVTGTAFDWQRVPPRIEGVIERRLGRLPPDLRRALRAACVEGLEFTAEAVSRVEGLREQSFIRRLSAVAVRQHRLVEPPSLQWIGSRPLSRYRFRHPLFQQYLYQTLDEAERRVLHGAMGRALETLFGDQADRIAAQLARHFQAAGDVGRARDRLLRAEERARRLAVDPDATQPDQRAGGETGPSSGPGKPLDFGA
jgi:predicted ATPase